MTFQIETDHKPLLALLGTKHLDELSPRILRFRMRLMWFHFSLTHVPCKSLATADALSRAPVPATQTPEAPAQEQLIEGFVHSVISSLPITEKRLLELKQAQQADEMLRQVAQYCQEGWPDEIKHDMALKAYWAVSADLTIAGGLLLKGTRLVIPTSMQTDVLNKIHAGHQGITKCRARAKCSVWWPGLSRQLQETVEKCQICTQKRRQPPEPLLPGNTPDGPWQKVGADLCHVDGFTYLVMCDYFSRSIEVARLQYTTSSAVVERMKSWFARNGVPVTVVTDNGPQFSSDTFRLFSKAWDFTHVTSSPLYPQSNGAEERAVQTVKNLFKKSSDPYLALLAYRSTPLAGGYSPSELLQGRRLRTPVPAHPSLLQPSWPDLAAFTGQDQQSKQKQKAHFDTRHRAKLLPVLNPGDCVWVRDSNSKGTVRREADTTQSYFVDIGGRIVRRNRRDLTVLQQHRSDSADPVPPDLVDVPLTPDHPEPLSPPPVPRQYPERVRGPPIHLQDFETILP